MQLGYYSHEAIRRRQYEREKAIAKKVIIGTIKTFLAGAVVAVLGFLGAYYLLVTMIDDNIDQSNIRDCEHVRTISLENWQELKNKCQHYYQTGEIEYMRKYHPELDR